MKILKIKSLIVILSIIFFSFYCEIGEGVRVKPTPTTVELGPTEEKPIVDDGLGETDGNQKTSETKTIYCDEIFLSVTGEDFYKEVYLDSGSEWYELELLPDQEYYIYVEIIRNGKAFLKGETTQFIEVGTFVEIDLLLELQGVRTIIDWFDSDEEYYENNNFENNNCKMINKKNCI